MRIHPPPGDSILTRLPLDSRFSRTSFPSRSKIPTSELCEGRVALPASWVMYVVPSARLKSQPPPFHATRDPPKIGIGNLHSKTASSKPVPGETRLYGIFRSSGRSHSWDE